MQVINIEMEHSMLLMKDPHFVSGHITLRGRKNRQMKVHFVMTVITGYLLIGLSYSYCIFENEMGFVSCFDPT